MRILPRSFIALLPWLLVLLATAASARDYQIDTVTDGLNWPWSLAFLPDGRMLVTERGGDLHIIDNGRLQDAPVAGLPKVYANSQGGLFEALPHPDHATNGWVYLSYAHGTPEANTTRVSRARLDGNRLVDLEVLFTARPTKDTPVHYGGRMAWLPDGSLVLGLGDGFDFRESAQQPDSHLGSIVRIGADGSVPADNPLVGRADARPKTWSYGHRNVQGLAWDDRRGVLWQHEHGPRGGDEINVIEAGANYGWPVATHGIDYSGASISPYTERPGMVDPRLVWTPSIAPAGLAIYRGEPFADWDGDLLVSALAARQLRRVELDGEEIVGQHLMLEELGERLRDVRVGPDGLVYVLTDAAEGRLLRLSPAP
ncbi:PQQ-dependent sugar dehydrogenase [Wenzhouxiangella sp. XN79A]|uniref:PQQ-dependent sugar dehydrogenase n=1 Tax=Wenzhouxiangella sp. XN79A TaxID=2724193 RepID=UPI00144A59CD|nr:PQQ-dependent sugar dehydrogenase [Wenzhouxiangella sp. XN79A]NKI35558.1 PQQ-dependent sugar dehydrogenase [Wenzhouxiangella sp. XN79A]